MSVTDIDWEPCLLIPSRNTDDVTVRNRISNSSTISRNRWDTPEHQERLRISDQAQRDATVCGRCGGAIPSNAPVALQQQYRFPGAYQAHETTTCVACAAEWLSKAQPYCEACPHCGRPIYRRRWTGRRFCCDRCRCLAASARRSASSRAQRTKPCDVCGRSFTAPRDDAITCSAACRQRAYRRRHRTTERDQ